MSAEQARRERIAVLRSLNLWGSDGDRARELADALERIEALEKALREAMPIIRERYQHSPEGDLYIEGLWKQVNAALEAP
jgi:hypothetical protein